MTKANVKVIGYTGTWYEINKKRYNSGCLYLMEHEQYGDNAPCIIINDDNEIKMEYVQNGFSDYDYCIQEGLDPMED